MSTTRARPFPVSVLYLVSTCAFAQVSIWIGKKISEHVCVFTMNLGLLGWELIYIKLTKLQNAVFVKKKNNIRQQLEFQLI